jgi:hypothetical protein
MIKNHVITTEPNGLKQFVATPIKSFFLCSPFVGFPSPHNMINTRRFFYVEGKENGSSYVFSEVAIEKGVEYSYFDYKNYSSNFPSAFFS